MLDITTVSSGTQPLLALPHACRLPPNARPSTRGWASGNQLASAGQFDGQGDHHTPKPYVRQTFRKYLECGIFAHGFARAWCDDCGHDYFIAYSCKGRGVCPSCKTRRMDADADANVQASPPGVVFHPASAIDADAVAQVQVQATLRKRILRGFVARGLLKKADAKDMLAYQHSGFSVDAGVCIEAHDRAAQAPGALSVGGADRQNLRSVPALGDRQNRRR